MQRLAEVARAAIVVDGDYPDLFRTQPDRGSWLADMLGRLAVRYRTAENGLYLGALIFFPPPPPAHRGSAQASRALICVKQF